MSAGASSSPTRRSRRSPESIAISYQEAGEPRRELQGAQLIDLTDDYDGVATRPLDEAIGRRDIYALLPPGDRHPLARHVVDALTQTARELVTRK